MLVSGALNLTSGVVWHALIKIKMIDNTKYFFAILRTRLNFTVPLEADLNLGFMFKV